jgi:dual specificity phosphatase 12
VYVHCKAGNSRAGLVTVGYLMWRNGWTRDEALEFVRVARPQVQPNPAFMGLLLEWEKSLMDCT